MDVRRRKLNSQDEPPRAKGQAGERKKKSGLCSGVCRKLVIGFLAVYFGALVAMKYSHTVQDVLVYQHFLPLPLFANHSNPAEFGLTDTRQFSLTQHDGCLIHAWHVLPKSYAGGSDRSTHRSGGGDGSDAVSFFEDALKDGAPIILYMHGNTGSRAMGHRVALYKYLAWELGCHVIAFDYRGYGESTCWPSEVGMMEDGYLVWKWMKRLAPNGRVFLWGHSLGSAATTYLASELNKAGEDVEGIVLDSPFTNMTEAAANHRFAMPYWPILSLLRPLVLTSLHEKFASMDRFPSIACPILITHGKQDYVLPFSLGYQVYEAALESRRARAGEAGEMGSVEFVECKYSGHKTCYLCKEFQEAVQKFISA